MKEFVDHLIALEPRHRQRGATRLAASTVRRIVAPLKAMLAEAYELEVIDSNAGKVRIVVYGDMPRQRPRTLTSAQIDAILEHLSEGDRLLFALLARTGLRISEALGAQWRDIERRADGPVLVVRRQCCDGELRERTKTPAGMRSVALVPSLAQALASRRAASLAGDGDPVFPSACGTYQDSHNVRWRLRPAAVAAGTPWATPHVFRHSLATELLCRGFDPVVIARILGHRNDTTTRRIYIHPPETPRFDELDNRHAREED